MVHSDTFGVNSISLPVARPEIEKDRILSAIDIGTNSVHMVIVRVIPSIPSFTIIDREKETVRLGDRTLDGLLKPEVMKKAIAALQRFQKIALGYRVEEIIAVATSAVRESANGKEFLDQIKQEVGLGVDLISGQEEARRIYLGVLSGMSFDNQPHIIIDIGGGSTELILGEGKDPRFLSSTKVGAVRLSAEFVKTDPISDPEFNYLLAYLRGMLERPAEELRSHLKPHEIPKLVGTSGTIETLAQILIREKQGIEPSQITGSSFTLIELENLISRLRKMTNSERSTIPGMSERRSEIILPGALILAETMSLLGVEEIRLCERSLREGVVVDWMLTHGLIEDQFRFQSSIRQRSVLKVAQKYQVNIASANRVAQFALSLFDQTNGVLHDWGALDRELFWAAAILHDCGYHISYAAHHKHSYYLIRHSELLGYTETEIEIIANIARYHRKSPPKKKHPNFQNLSKQHRLMVNQLSAIHRIAVALDRRLIGAVDRVKCEFRSSPKQIHLHVFPSQPDDDCALELWSVDYKKEAFEQEFGVKLTANLAHVSTLSKKM